MQANSWYHKLFHFDLFFWIWKVWEGRGKITKIWISWEQKELFRWNRKHFSQFLKGYPEKIVDTSFNAFYQNFISKYYFFPNDEKWSKTMKNAFYFIKKALFILKIFKFLYIHFPPFFSPSAIALEVDSRKS